MSETLPDYAGFFRRAHEATGTVDESKRFFVEGDRDGQWVVIWAYHTREEAEAGLAEARECYPDANLRVRH